MGSSSDGTKGTLLWLAKTLTTKMWRNHIVGDFFEGQTAPQMGRTIQNIHVLEYRHRWTTPSYSRRDREDYTIHNPNVVESYSTEKKITINQILLY